MSNVWFTSDWHLGHRNVLNFADNFRSKVLEVSTIQEHDEFIWYQVLNTVVKRDILYVLGDNGCPDQTYELMKACQAMQIRYLPGNHDRDTGIARLAELPRVTIWPPATYKNHWITHCPMHPRELWSRKCIHGHVHSDSVPDENYINVSVEAVGKPILVNFNDIKTGAYTTHE